MLSQGRRQKNFQGGRGNKKILKNSKKDRKIYLLSLFQGRRATEKTPINSKKKSKNSTIKPLFTISLPCVKI